MRGIWRWRVATLVCALVLASIFALTALAGSGTVSGGTTLTYSAVPGEVNHITVSVVGGHLTIADTAGVTATGTCPLGLSGLDCGLVSSLTGPMTINAGDGSDTVTIDSSVNSTIPSITISGGTGNDTLVNNSNRPVTFSGGAGNDTITGKAGDFDRVDYSSSPSGVTVDLAAGTATGQGNDTLTNISDVIGSSHDDTISGDDRANYLVGGAGNDTIDGRQGDDNLDGGGGADTVDYSDSTSTTSNGVNVDLGSGTETAGAGSDAGNDTLANFRRVVGSPYDDTITGSTGDDTLDPGAGNDTVDGGPGEDTLSYASAPAGVSVNLGADTASDGQGGTDTIAPNSIEDVAGSAFDDTLSGDGNDNVLSGGAGNDDLLGGAGNDTLDGGSGSNTADYSAASAGVDANIGFGGTSAGGDGDGGSDTYMNIQNLTGSSTADTLTGDDGPNVINGGGGADTIDGGPGDDTLNGQSSADTISGGSGNDAIDGGTGTDEVDYSSATASSATDGVNVNLATGKETATGTNDAGSDTLANVEDVVGTPFADTLDGDAGTNELTAGGGNDSFVWSGGGDTFDGGTGTNSLDFSGDPSGIAVDLANTDVPQPGADNSTIASNAGQSSIQNVTGTPQADAIFGDAQANVLNGGADNDTLAGRGGNDTLDGGSGNDTASYQSAASSVDVDLRTGTAASDGDGGSDTLASIENVAGSPNSDTIQGDAGNNLLVGGGGNDLVSYSGAAGPVTVNLAAGVAIGDGTDTLAGISSVTGSSFADTLTASPGGSVLNGGGGDDTLIGSAGNDAISGGSGNDDISGGSGTNFLDGGLGIDTLDYSSSSGAVTVNLGTFGPQSTGGGAIDTIANFENVTGSTADDVLTGDGNDNVLKGGGGNDVLQGGAGDDTLNGGTGSDTADYSDSAGGVGVDLSGQSAVGDGSDTLSSIESVNGSNQSDTISGDSHANTIHGLGGNDTIDGGGGPDNIDAGLGNDTVFAKDGVADTIACGAGSDTATVDSIDVVAGDCEVVSFLGGSVVNTFQATAVGTNSATLNGSINPDGRAVTYQFNYGLTSGYGQHTAPVALASGHSTVQVSAAVSSLLPGTTYHFQLVATDGLGNTFAGGDQSFTTGTQILGPTAVTLSPSAGTPPGNTAVLTGLVNTNGTPTTWFFQYGTTTAYGQQTAATLLGATSTGVLVATQVPLSPAPPSQTWHYRLVVTNQVGTAFGSDVSFSKPLSSTHRITSKSEVHHVNKHKRHRKNS